MSAIISPHSSTELLWNKILKTFPKDAQPATNSLPCFSAASLALLPPSKLKQVVGQLPLHRLNLLMEEWKFWARPSQLAPKGPWKTWLFLGGRGAGKTRAAAEWVREAVESETRHNIALLGPTIADVRDIMVEGESGLLAIASSNFRPKFEPSNRRIIWPNGAKATLYSAEVPDSLRGPQFDLAWGDEVAAWPEGQTVLDTLRPALRLGEDPRLMLSTTPRPVSWIKALLNDETCVVTRNSSRDNRAYLAEGFIEDLESRYANSIYGRQELEGELIDDPEGALWTRDDIARARNHSISCDFERIIVAVDPPASAGKNADTCGIIVAASFDGGKKAAVLADISTQGQNPSEWAKVIANAYSEFDADCILAEANQGGEMVREIISLAAPDASVRLIHASKSKRVRAEPIALLYSQGRVAHNSHFRELEDEMCSFGAPGFTQSPDRMDALVWAVSHLLLGARGQPRARTI